MQVFKAALRIFFKHPLYIAVYVIWLSAMGILMGAGNVQAPQSNFNEQRPDVAVIDRDKSDLSEGITAFIADHANMVEVEDSRLAMQDASAQKSASYLIIIPENYGEEFVTAATHNTDISPLETVISYESITPRMMNGLVNEYLATARFYIASDTTTVQSEIVDLANKDMEHATSVEMIQFGQSGPISQQWLIYMQFSGYTLILSIAVCIGIIMASFSKSEIRRRNTISPLNSFAINLQLGLACAVVALLVGVWVNIFGLLVFGSSLASIDPAVIGVACVTLMVFTTVPLSLGFLLGQLTKSELILNATSNIVGLTLSFLGGIWVSLDYLGKDIAALAHFTPTFYYGEALQQIAELRDCSLASLMPLFGDMGLILLFSLALFVAALIVARLRVQSSDAGGNTAAASLDG